jgi:triosephosphate isomerase
LRRPLIINFKNYIEASGERTIELAKAAEKVAESLRTEIVLAPPQAAAALVSRSVSIPVICQHLDTSEPGSTTGFFVPEIARSYGVAGSILNHSEHRIDLPAISSLVRRMRRLGMTSIVCAQTPREVKHIAELNPDFIAIEPPELIGTGRAVSKENPSVITESIRAAGSARSHIICGAGISDQTDVSTAMRLGSQGILVASGVIKAAKWQEKIAELAQGME